jgi:tetratricopeptide (TPR) repeat protein
VGGNRVGTLAIFVALAMTATGCPAHDEQSPSKSAKRLDICKDFLSKNDLEAAESECTKAIALNTNNDEAYLIRGIVSYLRASASKKAMEVDGCLTGVDAEAMDKDLQLNLQKADQDFERAVKINPEYGEAWNDRGIVASLDDDYEVARGYFEKALNSARLADNPTLTRANLGWALFNQEKYVDAAKELLTALQFQPKMCVATYRLGRVYFARQEWDKAAEQFQAVSDDPSCGSQEAGYYLMKTRMQQGLVAEAKGARDACLKLSPKSCIATKCRAEGVSL